MAKDNYSYKKYQKELARKKKAEEKTQRRLNKKARQIVPEPGQAPDSQAALEKETPVENTPLQNLS
jgi:hypothetical protein